MNQALARQWGHPPDGVLDSETDRLHPKSVLPTID